MAGHSTWDETKLKRRKAELAAIRAKHLLCTHSSPGKTLAGCACGTTFGWDTREAEHADHLDAVVIGHFEEQMNDLKVKLQHLKNMAETAEEDIETGADYYYEPVVSVAHLRRNKLI